MRNTPVLLVLALTSGCFESTAVGVTGNDAADNEALRPSGKLAYEPGPQKTNSAEYRLPASTDAEVLRDRTTEIWAVVHYPDPLPAERSPVLLFLHGNHSTCGHGSNPRIDDDTAYTSWGECSPGDVVVPNHRGYDYLAQRLASWGFVVVSINANRGITAGYGVSGDWGLNLARGRLVLKHLELLSRWDTTAGATPASLGIDLNGKLDLSHVGLMGHSRGGEGVRAALQQYVDTNSPWPARMSEPIGIQAVLEIGPVDGQTSRTLTPSGVAWGVVIPGCDGDVYDLQGLDVFERALSAQDDPRPKMAVVVWGANHNFFNTEWQSSDASTEDCPVVDPLFADPEDPTGSARQRQAGLMAAVSFFRAYVGPGAEQGHSAVWNSDFTLAKEVEDLTRFERAFEYRADHRDFVSIAELDNEDQVTTGHASVSTSELRREAIRVSPQAPGAFMDVAVPSQALVDAAHFATTALSVRAAAPAGEESIRPQVRVQLLDRDGSVLGEVPLTDYVELGSAESAYLLATARIHLSEFSPEGRAPALGEIARVRFAWDAAAGGSLLLSELGFVDSTLMPAPEKKTEAPALPLKTVRIDPKLHVAELQSTGAGALAIRTSIPFGVRAGLYELYADAQRVANARVDIDSDGVTARVEFDGPAPSDLASRELEIRYGERERWLVK